MTTADTPTTTATATERAAELLSRMTLEEKAMQLSAVMTAALLATGMNPEALQAQLGQGIGHLSNPGFAAQSPEQLAQMVGGLQRFLVEHTRLGIPAMVHMEALNGVVGAGYSSFPTAIGLAATWDPAAVEEMADLIRRQMRAAGVHQALSPVLDVARDARWGRVHETYGEDVYLTSAMGVAFVRGLQGEDLATGVIATGKHFLGYAMTEGGQNMASTHLGSRELYDVYATPFEAAIKLAGLRSIMNSYSEIDGVPVATSRAILTHLLRDRMGFEGSVVSDYSTVEWVHTRQRLGSSIADAGLLTLAAGLDIELPSIAGYGTDLADAVLLGRLDERLLDDAVMRALVDKFSVGLFENPYPFRDVAEISAVAGHGGQLSRRLADESITLIKNESSTLPLQAGIRVAVVGPNAESAMVNFAAYTQPAQLDMIKGMATGESRMAGVSTMQDVDPAAAEAVAKQRAMMMAIDSERVARQAYNTLPLAEAIGAYGTVTAAAGVSIHPDDPQDIAAAVAAAQDADVIVLAIGGRAGWFGTRITEGEGTDVARIELPAHQVELVRAVAAVGKPMIGVVYQGRTYSLTEVEPLLDAILVAYYPGPEGPRAVASVIFGETNPGGRLPYSMPRTTGQVPLYYSQHNGSGFRRGEADMFRGYIDEDAAPLYAFGHGLSYTSFEYSELTVDVPSMPANGGCFTARVEVRNIGNRDGAEVVQLYVSDTAAQVTRPALQLVGFQRVEIAAGAAVTVSFEVAASQLGYSDVDGTFVIEPGPIEVKVGGASDALSAPVVVDIEGEKTPLNGRRSYLSSTSIG
jgi:beta-glucosidase